MKRSVIEVPAWRN